MRIAVDRSRTANNGDSPSEKEDLFYNLTKTIVTDFTKLVDDNIYNYMQNYIN